MFHSLVRSRLLHDVLVIAVVFLIYKALVFINIVPMSVQGLVDAVGDLLNSIIHLFIVMIGALINLLESMFNS